MRVILSGRYCFETLVSKGCIFPYAEWQIVFFSVYINIGYIVTLNPYSAGIDLVVRI